MSPLLIAVDVAGLAAIAWIVWFFWLSRRPGVAVAAVAGVQEVRIRVKGGYDPDVIVVRRGVPVRLHFTRQESALCSETVVFDQLGRSEKLPEGKTVTVAFTPEETGEIPFQCQMGMLRGRVVVTE
jgi:plastocyanin domain-containing protein